MRWLLDELGWNPEDWLSFWIHASLFAGLIVLVVLWAIWGQ